MQRAILSLQESLSLPDPRLGEQYTYIKFGCPLRVVFHGHGIGALEAGDKKSGVLTVEPGGLVVIADQRVTADLPNVEWVVGHSFILYLVAVDDVTDSSTPLMLYVYIHAPPPLCVYT